MEKSQISLESNGIQPLRIIHYSYKMKQDITVLKLVLTFQCRGWFKIIREISLCIRLVNFLK